VCEDRGSSEVEEQGEQSQELDPEDGSHREEAEELNNKQRVLHPVSLSHLKVVAPAKQWSQ
jgi:hypothetical protein